MNDEDRRLKNSFKPPEEKPAPPTLKESLNDLWQKWKDSSGALKLFVGFALLLVVLMFIQAYETDVEESPPTTTEALWLGHYPVVVRNQYTDANLTCPEVQEKFEWVETHADGFQEAYGSDGSEILDYLTRKMELLRCHEGN